MLPRFLFVVAAALLVACAQSPGPETSIAQRPDANTAKDCGMMQPDKGDAAGRSKRRMAMHMKHCGKDASAAQKKPAPEAQHDHDKP